MQEKEMLQMLEEKLSQDLKIVPKEYVLLQEVLENQRIRYLKLLKEHENWRIMLIRDNVVLRKICMDEIIHELEEEEWQTFEKNFELIYPFFISKLKKACPKILKIEIKTCCLVKLNVRTKRIAGLLGQRENTISKRKKEILTTYFSDSNVQCIDELLTNWF